MSYNRAILMGRITHDLELKTTASGVSVCSFSIAVDRRFQTKGEEKKSDFFNVVAWRQQAEFVCRYFGKGRMVLVEGELQTRSYVDKNGQNVRVVELIADQISFTGEPKQSGGNYAPEPYGVYGSAPAPAAPPAQSYNAPQQPAAPAPSFAPAGSDDDYPF